MKKSWGIWWLILFIGMSLSSCGKIELPEVNEKEQIVIWAWDESFNIKALKEAKKSFRKTHKNVEFLIAGDGVDRCDRASDSRSDQGAEPLGRIVLDGASRCAALYASGSLGRRAST